MNTTSPTANPEAVNSPIPIDRPPADDKDIAGYHGYYRRKIDALEAKLAAALAPKVVPKTPITPELLATEFPTFDGQAPDTLPALIEDFLPEGVTFFGAPSGTVKTWVGLSISKALITGGKLWNTFVVSKKTAVLYLIPEASDGTFKRRLKKMRFPANHPMFRYRTISQGVTKPLQDPLVLAMVDQLLKEYGKVVVFVDTAIRFLRSKDENASAQNSLNIDSEVLRAHGASVEFMHHSPKLLSKPPKSKKDYELKLLDAMTQETALRVTSDFSAMSDCIYGLLRDDILHSNGDGPEEVLVKCCKPRDLDNPPKPFRLVLRRRDGDKVVSVIDTTGDLGYVNRYELHLRRVESLVDRVQSNPKVSLNTLAKESCIYNKERVVQLLEGAGWRQEGKGKGTKWVCLSTSFIK